MSMRAVSALTVLAALVLAAPLTPRAQAPTQEQAAPEGQRPILMVETGAHSAPIRRLDVSAARGLVVTASDDRTARVWDLAGGALRLVLRPSAFGIEGGRLYGAAIHPREPLVAVAGTTGDSGGRPHLIYLFDLDTGALRNTIDARAGDIRKLVWSADGTVLLAGYSGSHGVRAFSLDGNELLNDPGAGPVFGLAVATNGLAASVGLDGELRSYRAAAGRVQRLASSQLGARRPSGVAFSPDGSRLAVAFATRGEGPELLDASTLQSQGRLPAATAYGGDQRVVAWSADGRTLASAGTAYTQDLGFWVYEYDLSTRRVAAQGRVADDSITDLQALPDGGWAYSSFDGSWGLLPAGLRAQPQRFGSALQVVRGNAPTDLELSADARSVQWGIGNPDGGLAFTFEGRRLAQAPSGRLRSPQTRFGLFSAPSDWANDARPPVVAGKPLQMAADERGRAMVVLGTTPQAAVFGTNRALHRVAADGSLQWRVPVDTEVRALNTSADGRLLVGAMADGTLRWWRAADGVLLLTLLTRPDGRWVVWTPSGYFDASAGADRLAGWALPQGEARGPGQAMSFYPLNRFREQFNRPDVIDTLLQTLDEAQAFAVLAARDRQALLDQQSEAQREAAAALDAQRLASERAEAARAAALEEAQRLAAAEAARRDALARAEAAARAEAERLAAVAQARAQALRDAAERNAALLAAAAREAAERGRQAEEAAQEARRMAARQEALRVEAERLAQERAELAAAAAREADARRTAAARLALKALKAIEFPPDMQAVIAANIRQAAPQVVLPFALRSPLPAGPVTVEVRLAGRPLRTAEIRLPASFDGVAKGFARIDVDVGSSTVEIIASNQYGSSEPLSFRVERVAPAPAVVAAPSAPGTPSAAQPTGSDLYVLSIGVADYARPQYRLGLAAKDASDFAAVMQAQQGRQYRRVVVRTLTNAEATRSAVLAAFKWLQSSVGEADTAMLFMAGHGLNDSSGQYYFLPHDGQHEKLLTTAVPQSAIVSTLAQLRGRAIMFVDTCFAGNALGALSRATRSTDRLMNDLSASENGVLVFASSTGQEESRENAEWGNGAFTKALLDGLGGKADFMRAGRVTYAGLNLYVSEEVFRLTKGRQRPVFISPKGIPDFSVARL